MADQKISQLSSATTPLQAADTLPVVQSSITKKVSASTFAQVGQDNAFTASQTLTKTGASNTQVVLVSALDGSNDYQSALSVRRTGTVGGALFQSKRNVGTGGVGWVARVTTDNSAEVNGTFTNAFEILNTLDVQVSTAGKGIILTNAAGTVTKRVRLNDAGDGLVFENP